ncbi:MAG: histone deacetylase [Candidatus Tectomicrobia bacterium]|uniref:Histone deacetylase n=1 Tax=Tectimicrobiota bacterium TaxID=2528274 RepID=A0A932ZTA4_UNCTE|nr:histone deacetylase [Candidatus Tectomicrobia bacterium]
MKSSTSVFVYHPGYYADVGVHVLQQGKYRATYERLRAAGVPEGAFIEPRPATEDEVRLVHTAEYVADLLGGVHTERTCASELPLSAEIVRAAFLAVGGTILAAREALARGRALNLTGGFHHAFAGQAEGFCYLNDLAVAIRVLQREGAVGRAAVIDCDLHQGNGTAVIFQGDPGVFTFSIHQQNIYPVKRKSDLDVGLYDLAGDAEYLAHMRKHVPEILDGHRPGLVLYQAGADPYASDQLGTLKLTMGGLRERDAIVLSECARRGIPVAGTLGGGYAADPADTVDIHFRTAMAFWGMGPGQ